MGIERKISCDICKQVINPEDQDAIVVQGNVCVPNLKDKNGVGGGIFGGSQWLERIDKPQINDEPLSYEDIPLNHLHINCINGLISTNKRA